MRHKIVSMISTLTMFLCVFASVIPLGQAVQWSPEMRLTWDYEVDASPSITQTTEGNIWIVWHSYRNGNAEIFYKVYNGSLVHPWSSDTRLTNDTNNDVKPSIMQALDGTIWIVWRSDRAGNDDIYYKTYNGSTWSSDEPLTTDPSRDRDPSIMQTTNGTIWVVWESNRTGDFEIYYKTSSNNGETWTQKRLTTYPSVNDQQPSVMQATDGRIWIVWVRNFDIFYTIYNGTAWSPEETITTDPDGDWEPSIMQAKNGVWVVWSSDRSLGWNTDLYYNIYDGSWSGDTRLTTDEATDAGPSILQAVDDTIWIAWYSTRAYNMDIYYKTNSTVPENDVSVFSVSHNTLNVTQGKNATIEVVAQNKGTNAQTFQVMCYANSTLIGTRTVSLDPGQLNQTNFQWNTTNAAVGTYILKGEVSPVPGETYLEDNTYEDGTIDVLTHDVAVLNVWPSQTVAHRGYTTVYVYVEIRNEGNFTESFGVTAYYDHTAINTYVIRDMAPNTATILTYPLSKYLTYGNYTLSAKASPVPDELDLTDNSFTDDTVKMTIPGDVDGNGVVNNSDLSKMSEAYGSSPPEPNWYANCDTNNDDMIDIYDLSLIGKNYGKSEP